MEWNGVGKLVAIQSHTMRLFPSPCLTVGGIVLSESGSPFLFQEWNGVGKLVEVQGIMDAVQYCSIVRFWRMGWWNVLKSWRWMRRIEAVIKAKGGHTKY